MALALGATNVPFPVFIVRVIAFLILVCASPPIVHAIEEGKPLHYSADRQVWNRKANKVELFGHATVSQPGETLSADYINLDLTTRDLDAHGNCVYIASDSVVLSDEMHFNLDTRTGTVMGGRISNERFTLAGDRINKLGENRFQTHWGEYSTCRDCPQSWAFQAEDVDMQIDGYAYMSNVMVKIKDAPTLWLPYLIVPMKTRRQTGLLFPRLQFSTINGAVVVVPFFWAISRSLDMTIGLGEYTARGRRAEWEGRYALSDRSGGVGNFNYLHDSTFAPKANRWSASVGQTQELPQRFEEKLKISEVSDNYYPYYIGDINVGTEQYLSSDLIISNNSSYANAYVAGRRFRNLLYTSGVDSNSRLVDFDPTTVQIFPTALVTSNDKYLFGTPVAAGVTVGMTNFTRTADTFDFDPAGNPIIRKATRFYLNPSMYTTFRPFDLFSVVPSVQYRNFSYLFHNEGGMSNLNQGYLLVQADLSAQLEKIYDTDDPNVPKVKHLIRPKLTYSNIPYFMKNYGHPFVQQIRNGTGYNFDNYDIIPLDTPPQDFKYFTPLGNSLAYGLTTQVIRRKGKLDDENPSYAKSIELSAGQAINFREFQKSPGDQQPFSRFFTNLLFEYSRYSSNSTYYYYPYIGGFRHYLITSHSVTLERGLHQRILSFDRSVNLTYALARVGCVPGQAGCDQSFLGGGLNYSLSDYIMPQATAAYDLANHHLSIGTVNLVFQSPSQCWRMSLGANYQFVLHGTTVQFDLSMNLSGTGFGGPPGTPVGGTTNVY